MKNLYATERWTVSRGQETYGYNICTIEVFDAIGERQIAKGQCKGGGYDMAGTSLAEALQSIPEVQARLQKSVTPDRANSVQTQNGGFTHNDLPTTLYGTYLYIDGTVRIDGATGYRNVQDVLKLAGIEVRENYRGSRNPKRIGWFVTINE